MKMNNVEVSVKDILKDLSMEYFADSPIYLKYCETIEKIQKYQEVLYSLSSQTEDSQLTLLKVGTILTNGIIAKMLCGTSPRDFTKEDWMEISGKTVEMVILWDSEKYTLDVFRRYSKYIDFCIEINEKRGTVSDTAISKIKELTFELNELNELFEHNEIKESDYVDRCLWICFDAMMKFMASYITNKLPTEYSELIQAVSDYTVQYARLKLYKKEQALLQEYLDNQKVLDDTLKGKFELYLVELDNYSKQTIDLINRAFDPQFRYELQNSVELARNVGVKEELILDSIDKIDDFFG